MVTECMVTMTVSNQLPGNTGVSMANVKITEITVMFR